jgi:hypothetical protein
MSENVTKPSLRDATKKSFYCRSVCILTCVLERQICCYSVRADMLSSGPDLFVFFAWRIGATTPIRLCVCVFLTPKNSFYKNTACIACVLTRFCSRLTCFFLGAFCMVYLCNTTTTFLFVVWCICDREGPGKVDEGLKRILKERARARERDKNEVERRERQSE